MADLMTFPNTWEEYERIYGFTDAEEIYTNGARLIPSFRVEQWLEHIAPAAQPQRRVNAESTQKCVGSTQDCVNRRAVIDEVSRWRGYLDDDMINRIQIGMKRLPTAQPDLPEAYAKKVWTWLLDYQTTAAELKAKYSAYEVLSWVVNDWRRGHGGLN